MTRLATTIDQRLTTVDRWLTSGPAVVNDGLPPLTGGSAVVNGGLPALTAGRYQANQRLPRGTPNDWYEVLYRRTRLSVRGMIQKHTWHYGIGGSSNK
ncbi:hypothetical protein Tco_0437215, partial [Tanacetum coccineum]